MERAPLVIYDANVLFPAPLRDLLIRIGLVGLARVRWSEAILDECFRNVSLRRPDLSSESLARTRYLMNLAIRDVVVTGYEPLINGLTLPDPDDRHVLAAAIHAGASQIVTFNGRDFPESQLAPYGLRACSPDLFLGELVEARPEAVLSALRAQAAALRNPPHTVLELLDVLDKQNISKVVAALRALLNA